jgi:hypothetical protein
MLAGLALVAGFLVAANTPAADLDTMVPADAEAVIKLNIKQVLDSALVKKYALNIIKQSLQSPEAQQMITATGLDPLKDLDSITVTAAGTTNPRVLIVVRGKFDMAKINAAMATQAEKDKTLTKIQDGRLTIWKAEKDQNPLFSTVPNQGSMVMSTDKDYLIKSVGMEGKNQTSAELKAAVAKVPGKESLWVAGIITEDIKKKLADNPQTKKYAASIKSITGGITVTDALQLNAQIHTNDGDVAKELKKVIEGFVPVIQLMTQGNEQYGPLIKEVLDGLKVSIVNTTVSVDLKVSEELIKKIAQKQ